MGVRPTQARTQFEAFGLTKPRVCALRELFALPGRGRLERPALSEAVSFKIACPARAGRKIPNAGTAQVR